MVVPVCFLRGRTTNSDLLMSWEEEGRKKEREAGGGGRGEPQQPTNLGDRVFLTLLMTAKTKIY